MAEFDHKEYARQMRENCAKGQNGNIICSAELWEQIASIIESAADVVECIHITENMIKGHCDPVGDPGIDAIPYIKQEFARKIISEAETALHDMAHEYINAGHPEYFAVCEMVYHKVIRRIEKKYTKESEDKT